MLSLTIPSVAMDICVRSHNSVYKKVFTPTRITSTKYPSVVPSRNCEIRQLEDLLHLWSFMIYWTSAHRKYIISECIKYNQGSHQYPTYIDDLPLDSDTLDSVQLDLSFRYMRLAGRSYEYQPLYPFHCAGAIYAHMMKSNLMIEAGMGRWLLKRLGIAKSRQQVSDYREFGKHITFKTPEGVEGISKEDGAVKIITGVPQITLTDHMVIGYKGAWHPSKQTRVLVALLIPKGARTNMNMGGDKFRTDKAQVAAILPIVEVGKDVRIIDMPQPYAWSFFDPRYKYTTGSVQIIDNFAATRSRCAQGIHFFLEPRSASRYAVVGTKTLLNEQVIYDAVQRYLDEIAAATAATAAISNITMV